MNTVQAGRELDALVAEKVMGFTLKKNSTGWYYKGANGLWPTLLPYSTSIAAAWQVVEKMKHFVLRRKNNSWTVEYRDCQNPMDHMIVNDCCASLTADTAPLAICLAALKAVGS